MLRAKRLREDRVPRDCPRSPGSWTLATVSTRSVTTTPHDRDPGAGSSAELALPPVLAVSEGLGGGWRTVSRPVLAVAR